MNKQFRVDDHEVCHDGYFRLERYRLRHTLFAGGWSRPLVRELFERGHAVAVLPYDPRADAVVLVEQFRIGALQRAGGPWLIEAVAGILETGEAPEAVARREAVEETGLALTELESICRYYASPGGTSETIHLYCGMVDARGAGGIHGLEDEGEDIRVHVLPVDRALDGIGSGMVDSAPAIIALQWLTLNRERLRLQWGAR